MIVWWALILSLVAVCLPCQGEGMDDSAGFEKVQNGIDVLLAEQFAPLQGLTVGLITNHTGRSLDGTSTIDLFHQTRVCRLKTLFSPEHGIQGLADEKVHSGTDAHTGLKVFSLYGDSRKPTPDMLKGLDALVFDIQDIGTRFYTYIGTLSLCMQAARENDLQVIVLDRPNPIGGIKIGGAIPSAADCGDLVSIHPIPTCHGMTVGELAGLFNDQFGIGCRLSVIPMKNWKRAWYFDETGQKWVNPSPNMKTLEGAFLYPGIGICETLNLSVARGTDHPFEMYGAPCMDGRKVSEEMSHLGLPGLEFFPVDFIPTASGHPFRGQVCHGVRIEVTDRSIADPFRAGLHLVQLFQRLYPGQIQWRKGFDALAGDRTLWRRLITEQEDPASILAGWEKPLEQFREVRKKYLLYSE